MLQKATLGSESFAARSTSRVATPTPPPNPMASMLVRSTTVFKPILAPESFQSRDNESLSQDSCRGCLC